MRTCSECGLELKPEQLLCQCGAGVGGVRPELGNFHKINVGLNFDIKKAKMPSLGLALPGSKSVSPPNFEIVHTSTAHIDLRTADERRGRSFKLIFGIGGSEQAAVKLSCPLAVVCLPAGDFLVLDLGDEGGSFRIQQFSPEGDLRKIVRKSRAAGPDEVRVPAAMAVDVRSHLFVSDMDGGCVREYASDGSWLMSYGREGLAEGEMSAPQGIVVDAEGSIYVADSGNNRVVRWSGGRQHLFAGINRLDKDEGWLLAGEGRGEFDYPQGLALGPGGHVLVADTNNHRIQVLDTLGGFVQAIGSEGEKPGHFSYPSHVRVAPDGRIFVADLNGRRIQAFDENAGFVYEIVLPDDLGALSDFDVDRGGHLLLALRSRNAVLGIEVE